VNKYTLWYVRQTNRVKLVKVEVLNVCVLTNINVAVVHWCGIYECFEYVRMCRDGSVQELLYVVSMYVAMACLITGELYNGTQAILQFMNEDSSRGDMLTLSFEQSAVWTYLVCFKCSLNAGRWLTNEKENFPF
jgi:hypothetical protein